MFLFLSFEIEGIVWSFLDVLTNSYSYYIIAYLLHTMQLYSHLIQNSLYGAFQSGLCPCHTTETALLRNTNTLIMAADSDVLSLFILLDLSVAFDTITHKILVNGLSSTDNTMRLDDCRTDLFHSA